MIALQYHDCMVGTAIRALFQYKTCDRIIHFSFVTNTGQLQVPIRRWSNHFSDTSPTMLTTVKCSVYCSCFVICIVFVSCNMFDQLSVRKLFINATKQDNRYMLSRIMIDFSLLMVKKIVCSA